MKKILVAALALGLMTGCAKEKEQKVTYCDGINNGHMVIYTITHTGDVVDESVRENVLSLDEEEVNQLLEIAPGYKEEMESIAGVTYEYNAVDTSFYEKIIINYAQADLEELIETNMVVVEEGATYVSLQSILDEAEGLGLTCGEE